MVLQWFARKGVLDEGIQQKEFGLKWREGIGAGFAQH